MIKRTKTPGRTGGFTLIELMVTVAVIAILAAIAMPNYREYTIRSSRQAVQSEMTQMASIQDKIFLNSNAYSNSVTAAYNGSATGGLGVTSGNSRDGKYSLTVTVSNASYTLTAAPVAGSSQASDGSITINALEQKKWDGKNW